MPLQNRVTPAGDIVAADARGLFMGNRGILHDAVAEAHLLADLLAEVLLLGVGHAQFAHVVGLLGHAEALADSAELSAVAFGYGATRTCGFRGTSLAAHQTHTSNRNSDQQLSHHVGLTSNIATGKLLPFTMTSPRG